MIKYRFECPTDDNIAVQFENWHYIIICPFGVKSFKSHAGAYKFLIKNLRFKQQELKSGRFVGNDVEIIQGVIYAINWQIARINEIRDNI